MRLGLTIGQAAAFAGVTVKTVRHYHRLGLLEEPVRSSNGYRRYGSVDLLRLVQVRTLAESGVPLVEVGGLLAAGPARFATDVADVEQRLTAQIERLVERRALLRRLTDGDRALLPDRACALLDKLRELGFEPEYVALQREALVLIRALVPDGLADFLTQLEHRLDDPHYVELARGTWEASGWEAEDPRLADLATAVADNLLEHLPKATPRGFRVPVDVNERLEVINRHRERELPALARLNALIEARLRSVGVQVPYR